MSTADLNARVQQLAGDESLEISRTDFRDACDEDDKLVYLTIARRMAKANKKWVEIAEDSLFFTPPPSK